MKVTLASICRRKHRVQNSNFKSRSFRYGYLLLSLCLLFLVSVPVFAVSDTSGSVIVDSTQVDMSIFEILFDSTGSWQTFSCTDFVSSSTLNYNRLAYASVSTEVSGTFKAYYSFPCNISLDSNLNYDFIVFSVNLGALNTQLLPIYSDFMYLDSSYKHLGVADSYESVVVNYSGVDFSGVNAFFIFDVNDLDFSNIQFFYPYVQWRLSGGGFNIPFVASPLEFKFYRNLDDVIADINGSVNDLVNQNNIIIQNQIEIKNKLDSIHISLSSDRNPDNPELDSELSDANQIEQDFKDKFQDFVDIDKIDRVENIITDWTNNTKIISSFIFVRNVLDLLFDEVPVLSFLFSVGSACIILTMLFGIVSHSFRSPSGNVAQDPRSYTYNYIMFSNLSQQQTLSSKKADFHAFEKFDGSWGV